MRGARIIEVEYLDACEGSFSDYMLYIDHALDYIDDARREFDYEDEREGIY